MTRAEELEQRRAWREHLQDLGTPQAMADLERLKSIHHAVENSRLGQDVYASAAGEGHPPLGWRRGSEDLGFLRQQVPSLSHLNDIQLREYFKPKESGFRAEALELRERMGKIRRLLESYESTRLFGGWIKEPCLA